jgi:DNA polymerase III sliding clamp (beta) subunit (PCNA family)
LGIKIIENPKKIVNKIISQFAKSKYDEKWSILEVDYDGTNLILTGGGSGLIISTKVKTQGEDKPFKVNVDLRKFFEAIKFMGKDVEIIKNKELILRKDNKEVKLFCYSDENGLPKIKDPRKMMGYKSNRILKVDEKTLESLKRFVATEYYMPSLTQIAWTEYEGKGYLVATDGHRLLDIEHNGFLEKRILINPDAPIQYDKETYVTFIKGIIIFSTDDQVIFQNIVNKNDYPDYKRILKSLFDNYNKVKINRNDLIFSLQSALSFAGGKREAAITISIEGDALYISSFNMFNSNQDIFSDELKIDNMNSITKILHFTTQYLLDGIRTCEEEEIEICFTPMNHIFMKENGKTILVMTREKL